MAAKRVATCLMAISDSTLFGSFEEPSQPFEYSAPRRRLRFGVIVEAATFHDRGRVAAGGGIRAVNAGGLAPHRGGPPPARRAPGAGVGGAGEVGHPPPCCPPARAGLGVPPEKAPGGP